MESFVYGTLNRASKFADESKIESMGPYAHVMDTIVGAAGAYREDINHEKFKDLQLYRGTCMKAGEIQQYELYVGKVNDMDKPPF